MPFKSKAQVKKFGALVKEGKLSKATFDEWAGATDFDSLPNKARSKRTKKGRKR